MALIASIISKIYTKRLYQHVTFTVWALVALTGQLILPAFVIVNHAQATDYNSTNFISRDPIQSSLGGNSTSTNYEQQQSAGEPIIGESNSSSFILRSGFLYYDTFTPRSQNWRWYSDYTNETPSTAMAGENIAPSTVTDEQIIKLRMTIKETFDIGYADLKFKLQYSTSSDFSSDVNDVVETGSCTSSSLWCYADGGGSDNGVITTKVLSDADSCASSVGDGCGTHNESGVSSSTFTHVKSAATEYGFTIKNTDTAYNTTYFFRAYDVTNNLPVIFNIGESYPSLVTSDVTLNVTISGVNSGTTTEGVTTDVTTTATAVNFGTLGFNTQVEAAHRITVSTSAYEGYQIFVYQRQGLLNTIYGSTEIVPVTGTNPSPAAWAIPGGADGAYGYHAGDDTLAGGSTRFSANNTYAALDSTAREIVYSSGPVTSEVTDIIYKSEVTNQQVAGIYTSRIVYIVVPTF